MKCHSFFLFFLKKHKTSDRPFRRQCNLQQRSISRVEDWQGLHPRGCNLQQRSISRVRRHLACDASRGRIKTRLPLGEGQGWGINLHAMPPEDAPHFSYHPGWVQIRSAALKSSKPASSPLVPPTMKRHQYPIHPLLISKNATSLPYYLQINAYICTLIPT